MKVQQAIICFIKKHIKIILAMLLLIALLSIVCLVNYSADSRTLYSAEVDKKEFEALLYTGYTVETKDDGRLFYKQNSIDPYVHLSLAGEKYNTVNVKFAEKVSKSASIQIYYSDGTYDISEATSAHGSLSQDRRAFYVFLPEGNYTYMRLDINADFSIEEVELLYTQNFTLRRELSISALVTLIISLALISLILVFEKVFGLRHAICERVSCFAKNLISDARDGKIVKAIVTLCFAISSACLLTGVLVILLLSDISSVSAWFVLICSSVTLVLFLAYNAFKANIKPAAVFLVVAIIIGCTIAIAQPPLSGVCWDDQIHYDRTVDLKCLLFKPERTVADNSLTNLVYPYSAYYSDTQKVYTDIISQDAIKIYPKTTEFASIYSGIGYIPAAFAMALSEYMGADIITANVVAKIFNVLVYAYVLYFGIKRLKSGALLFSSIALMPTALFLSASFSYDFFVTAFVGSATAVFISILQDKDRLFTVKDGLLLSAMFIIGCASKAIYFLLMLPLLFIRKDKFESATAAKRLRIAFIAVMLFILVSFALPFLLDTGSRTDNRGGTDVNATEQLIFVITNIFTYVKILFKFLLEYVSLPNASVYIGSYAYLGVSANFVGSFVILLIAFLAFVDKDESDLFCGIQRIRAVGMLTVLCQLALVATALYISFTPVAHPSIGGCQYRYIIPTLFISLYCIGSGKVVNGYNKRHLSIFVFAFLSFIALYSYITTISVYIG